MEDDVLEKVMKEMPDDTNTAWQVVAERVAQCGVHRSAATCRAHWKPLLRIIQSSNVKAVLKQSSSEDSELSESLQEHVIDSTLQETQETETLSEVESLAGDAEVEAFLQTSGGPSLPPSGPGTPTSQFIADSASESSDGEEGEEDASSGDENAESEGSQSAGSVLSDTTSESRSESSESDDSFIDDSAQSGRLHRSNGQHVSIPVSSDESSDEKSEDDDAAVSRKRILSSGSSESHGTSSSERAVDAPCCMCKHTHDPETMNRCQKCEKWFHWDCYRPPLERRAFEEDWFCSVCVDRYGLPARHVASEDDSGDESSQDNGGEAEAEGTGQSDLDRPVAAPVGQPVCCRRVGTHGGLWRRGELHTERRLVEHTLIVSVVRTPPPQLLLRLAIAIAAGDGTHPRG